MWRDETRQSAATKNASVTQPERPASRAAKAKMQREQAKNITTQHSPQRRFSSL